MSVAELDLSDVMPAGGEAIDDVPPALGAHTSRSPVDPQAHLLLVGTWSRRSACAEANELVAISGAL